MDLILNENLSQHSYILSGREAFLYRFCDTGFKNKWAGLWSMPHKFLEYFAFSVNGQWLSPENCEVFSTSEISSSHQFRLDEIVARELLFIPDDNKSLICVMNFQNLSTSEKNLKVGLEAAINVRDREENWHNREYEVKIMKDVVLVNSKKGSVVIGSLPSGKLEPGQEYREHRPAGEKQRCFIPGLYSVDLVLDAKSKDDIFFIISCGKNEVDAIGNYEDAKTSLVTNYVIKERNNIDLLADAKLDTNNDFINNLFRWSIVSLEKLGFDSEHGFGYFAGYPWFTQFWGRDLGWMLPAVIDYGKFEEARKALRTLAKFQSDGCIPNTIYPNGRIDYNSIDATLLWIIALHHYVKNSGDTEFLKEIKSNLVEAVDFCRRRDKDRDGFLEVEGKETWMDTLDRTGRPVEIQTFLIEALKCAGELFFLLEDSSRTKVMKEQARKTEKEFEKKFWDKKDKFYFDTINGRSRTRTINSIFPLLFGISQNPEPILDRIESEEFTSRFGVRTVSQNDKTYNPSGYHSGSAWGWITALTACAEFKNKRMKKAFEYLGILNENLRENCIGAIGEAWNSENNKEKLLKGDIEEEGCCLQGWSSALVIRAIDEFMLGIKIDAIEKNIIVSPILFDGMKVVRRKRVENDFVDLTFERKGNRLKVSYKSMGKRKYKLIKAPKV